MDDDSIEDWDVDDWEDLGFFTSAASEVAAAAQQCSLEPGGLHKAFQNTINSVKLFDLSSFMKTASVGKSLGPVNEIKNVISSTLDQQAATQSAAQSSRNFSQRLVSDPESPSCRAAMRRVTEHLTLYETSSNDAPHYQDTRSRPTKTLELEEYSESVITALYDIFYTSAYLPCTHSERSKGLRLSEEYICALRLCGNWHVPGDDTLFFFDSVIARKNNEISRWTPVQFQLPKKTRGGRHVVSPAEPEHIENHSSAEDSHALDDFCKILTWDIACFRIFVTRNTESDGFCYSNATSYSDIFPEKGTPMLLSTALKQNALSARHKIFLAFSISKAFWQYYGSDWMNLEWSLETLQLLQTDSLDSKAPFLKIESMEPEDSTQHRYNSSGASDGVPRLHRDPNILNLVLLLVQLGSANPKTISIADKATHLTGTQRYNQLCISCCSELAGNTAWPTIDLPPKEKLRYRHIVEGCLPLHSGVSKPLFEKDLDSEGRRRILRNNVVRPLFELFQDMAGREDVAFELPKSARSSDLPSLQAHNSKNQALKTQSDLACDWLDKITNHWLCEYVDIFAEDVSYKRPKVVIIDTGFDIGAPCANRKLKKRLSMLSKMKANNNWKDFWDSKAGPQDDHGHGTAMVSIFHKIAPFADISVARIAGKDDDLRSDPEKTGNNLAKAIRWAVKEQQADIVSLSFGWEQEPIFNGSRVISNAISKALSHCNQNLLIFAAASNLGGSKRELFPATHSSVFSIRATDTKGKHGGMNPSLPARGENVFGTLGTEVPASNLGHSLRQYDVRSGTSVATAIAAGIAAIVIGYINVHRDKKLWNNIRTFEGFQNLLYKLSTEPEVQKRFITLDNYSKEEDRDHFETALSSASNLKQEK